MPTFKLTIAYDGTGLRRLAAPGRPAHPIQGLLEDALRELDGRDVAVAGAGRTDAGVHALGQVASVCADARDRCRRTLVRALNSRLPPSASASSRPPTRLRRVSRALRRAIEDLSLPDLERRRAAARSSGAYAWHVPAPALDVDAMARGRALLEGRHDFAAFQALGSDTRDDRARAVLIAGVGAIGHAWRRCRLTDALVSTYDVAAAGFLRHMVRTIVGTLVEVGRGRRRRRRG